jgi:hypothetical protein
MKEIRRELRDLTMIVHALALEFKHSKQQTEREKENLVLELENKLLLWEKRVSPELGKADRQSSRRKRKPRGPSN